MGVLPPRPSAWLRYNGITAPANTLFGIRAPYDDGYDKRKSKDAMARPRMFSGMVASGLITDKPIRVSKYAGYESTNVSIGGSVKFIINWIKEQIPKIVEILKK